MSWGVYWMFYLCPSCGKKFKSGLDALTEPSFGICPVCGSAGQLIGESGTACPPDGGGYEDTAG